MPPGPVPTRKLTGILFPGPPLQPLVPDPALKLSPSVVNWLKAYNTEPRASNPSSRRAFAGAIEQAREWSEYYGRPVHVGEFGCFTTADNASRAHYYQAFREAAEEARDRLGHLGLEGRLPLLERKNRPPRARHAAGPLRQGPSGLSALRSHG